MQQLIISLDAQSFGKLATSSLDLQQGLFKNEADRVKSLIVAPKGSQILVADCTQIEMRILAALSSEPSWIQAFLENGDIHQLIAKQLQTFENSNKEFSEIQFRDYAKIISYSLMRGTSEQNISKVLKIPRQRIQSWMKFYRDTFCKVTKFLEEISEKGFRRGE